jgi:four helix bundle protein
MKYDRFEELPVWQDAIELAVRVFELTTRASFRRYRSVRDQIERAAMSVSNNIAEGFERGATQEILTFLYISRGSCGETRSILCLSERLPGLTHLRSEISNQKPRVSRGNFAPGQTHFRILTFAGSDTLTIRPGDWRRPHVNTKSS